MKNYRIEYYWKHVQGHIVTQVFHESISAENKDDAIEKFKEINPKLGQFIRKDKDGDYIYGSAASFVSLDKNNQVKAINLNTK